MPGDAEAPLTAPRPARARALFWLALACVALISSSCQRPMEKAPPVAASPAVSRLAAPMPTATRALSTPPSPAPAIPAALTMTLSPVPTHQAPTSAPSPTRAVAPETAKIVDFWSLPMTEADLPDPVDIQVLADMLVVADRSGLIAVYDAAGALVESFALEHSLDSITTSDALGLIYCLSDEGQHITVLLPDREYAEWALSAPVGEMVAVGERLWLASLIGPTIDIVDGRSGDLLYHLALNGSGSPKLALAPDARRVLAASGDVLTAIDADTHEQQRTTLGGTPGLLAVSADGSTVATIYFDPDRVNNVLALLDGNSLEVTSVADAPQGVSELLLLADGRILAPVAYRGHVVIIDERDTLNVEYLRIGLVPLQIRKGPGDLLSVLDPAAHRVRLLDAKSFAAAGSISLSGAAASLAMGTGGVCYVSFPAQDLVIVMEDGEWADSWPISGSPTLLAVSPDGHLVAVLQPGESRIGVYDTGGKQVASYEAGDRAEELSFSPDGRTLYAGDRTIDLTTGNSSEYRVVSYVEPGERPVRIVADTLRDKLYGVVSNGVAGSNGAQIVADLDQLTAAGWGYRSVVQLIYDESYDRFYVLHRHIGLFGLQVIDAATGQEIWDIPLSLPPQMMALNASLGRLYICGSDPSDGETGQLDVIDLALGQSVAQLDLPHSPSALCVDVASQRVYLAGPPPQQITIVEDAPASEGIGVEASGPLPRPTNTPVPTAPPQPLPTCPAAPDARLLAAWQAASETAALGCPLAAAWETNWATQTFEGGRMLWRERDRIIFVLFADGRLFTYPDLWAEGTDPLACDVAPPAGRQQPQRGFGLLWCDEPALREGLGWATAAETAAIGLDQPFQNGSLLRVGGEHLLLTASGAWRALGVE